MDRKEVAAGNTARPNNRRESTRYVCTLAVTVKPDGSKFPIHGETVDISEGGCYVKLMTLLPVGARVALVIWLGDNCVSIVGRVVTADPNIGNGIHFISLSERERYLAYLDTLGSDRQCGGFALIQ